MCGICGIVDFNRPVARGALECMTRVMQHRGPDDDGIEQFGPASLGFRRLSIIDRSAVANQPFHDPTGRYVLSYNGEVYNYVELKQELAAKGVKFRSTSDTEVALESLSRWGPGAIDRFNGMFAFAWYRIRERTLMLARDHAGIKPLYYYIHPSGKGVAFASQFNALLHTPWGEPGPIRQDVLKLYLQLHHVPSPFSLLENTYQLEPGEYREFKIRPR